MDTIDNFSRNTFDADIDRKMSDVFARLREKGGITRSPTTRGGRANIDRFSALTKIGQRVNIPALHSGFETGKEAYNYGKSLYGKLPGECRENPFSPVCVQKSYDTYTPDVEKLFQKTIALGDQWSKRDSGLRKRVGSFLAREDTQSFLKKGGEFLQSDFAKKAISKVGGSIFKRLFGR